MTTAEKVELSLIPVVGIILWLARDLLPTSSGMGSLLLASSALLLFQGLIRDLWLISKQDTGVQPEAAHKALCMCVESTVGVTGVAAGLIILGSAIDWRLSLSSWIWSVFVVFILAIGFTLKDFFFEWRPFRIRRDKDHVNIVFSWKR